MRKHALETMASLALLVGATAHAQPVRVDGTAFKDAQGRTLLLRGVNLGGSSKVPFKPSADPKAVSFVGRPFPLAEADAHFRRLQSWGLTTERLIVPWEAIEHAGPGQYDKAYLDYLYAIVSRARAYGIKVYIDPHQDSWSRAFGGDGAPYWASQAVGLAVDQVAETGAPQTYEAAPPDYWPPSAGRHGVATMETLFWAGNDLAPGLKIEGVPVQDFLQSHFINALTKVAERLRGLDNVIGFDSWNEPMPGYIGTADIRSPEMVMMIVGKFAAPEAQTPTFWDYMQAASGFAPGGKSVVKANPIWADGAKDVWRRYGVWDMVDGKPKLLKPDYFATVGGKPAVFNAYLKAFQLRYAAAIRKVAPEALVMQELSILGGPTRTTGMALGVRGIVSEPHFYDTMILLSKRYTPDVTYDFGGKKYEGREAVLGYYVKSLEDAKAEGAALGGVPTLLGEAGLRFGLNDGAGYRTGAFGAERAHATILFDAFDKALLSYSIWNYTADNDNKHGDWWRGEDLSIFSTSQRKDSTDINSGGRALQQIVRPYPTATAGTPVSLTFNAETRIFQYRFKADPAVKADTEIFVPALQYPHGFDVAVTSGRAIVEPSKSRVRIVSAQGETSVTIKSK